jgi:uncharacterized protein YutE (UPF0331/DUF86 family)
MAKVLIDKEKIIERIGDIKSALSELEKYRKMDLKEFLADKNNYPLASYWLRIALEAMLVIGTHILSRLPFNGRKKDYTQVILSLGDYDVLPKDFAQKIKGLASYRNRLVHLYWKIGEEELLSVIKERFEDIEKFIDYIEKFIEKSAK